MGSYILHCKQRLLPLNSVKKLIYVMVKHGVLFKVQTYVLNIIQKRVGFKGLVL
jgi:hypothetical protein